MPERKKNSRADQARSRAEYLFAFYYALGPERSLLLLQRRWAELGHRIAINTLKNYSAHYDWQRKVQELDIRLSEERNTESVREVMAMNDRTARLARGLQGLVTQALFNLQTEMQVDGGVSFKMPPKDMGDLLAQAQRIERLAMGEATERSEVAMQIWNMVALNVATIFMDINDVVDSQERVRLFATRMDEFIERQLVPAANV